MLCNSTCTVLCNSTCTVLCNSGLFNCTCTVSGFLGVRLCNSTCTVVPPHNGAVVDCRPPGFLVRFEQSELQKSLDCLTCPCGGDLRAFRDLPDAESPAIP